MTKKSLLRLLEVCLVVVGCWGQGSTAADDSGYRHINRPMHTGTGAGSSGSSLRNRNRMLVPLMLMRTGGTSTRTGSVSTTEQEKNRSINNTSEQDKNNTSQPTMAPSSAANETNTTLSPVPTPSPSFSANNTNTTTPTASPTNADEPTLFPTPSPSAHAQNTTTDSPTLSPTSTPTSSPSSAPSSSPSHVPVPHKRSSIGKVIARTMAWLLLIALSVLFFGAIMSNRYQIYYVLRGLWYTILQMECTRWIMTTFNVGQRSGSDGNGALNEIIFTSDLTEGLLMGDT